MNTNSFSPIPVIDLFAGPGGLGEGFTAYRASSRHATFRIALSIEKEPAAHSTFELRSFFRQFPPKQLPTEYYQHLQGKVSREELYAAFPPQAAAARKQAWKAKHRARGCSRARTGRHQEESNHPRHPRRMVKDTKRR